MRNSKILSVFIKYIGNFLNVIVKEEVGDITVPETDEEEMEPELENSLKMMGEEEKKVSPMKRLWVSWDKKNRLSGSTWGRSIKRRWKRC